MAVKTPNRTTPTNGNGYGTPAVVGGMGIGRIGLREWTGRIDEEFLKELKYERKYEVFKEMAENDPIVGAVLRAIEYLIRGVQWSIEAVDKNDSTQQELATFVDDCRTTMRRSWSEVLVEILSMLPYGWSFHEVLYERRSEGVCWLDWPIRAQESLYRWEFVKGKDGRNTDTLDGMTQRPAPDYLERTIPLSKGLLFRVSTHKANPEGRSILRNAYQPWYYKNHLQRIEAIGIERDLAGYPVLYVPGEVLDGVGSVQYEGAQRIITNIRRDEQEGALLSSARGPDGNLLWELKLLSTGGTRQFDTNAIVQRYDQRIAMSCLADFVLLGHEKVGSFALASTKTDVFALSLAAILEAICAVVNTVAIPRLLELNGIADPTKQVVLAHGDIEMPDLQELGAYITALSGAGVPLFPDMQLENRLKEFAGLPTLTQEEYDARQQQQLEDQKLQMDLQREMMASQAQGAKDSANTAQGAAADAKASASKMLEFKDLLAKQAPQPIHVHLPPMTVTTGDTTVTPQFTMTAPPPSQPPTVQLGDTHITVPPSPPASVTVPVTVETDPPVVHAPITVNAMPAQAPDVKVEVHPTVTSPPAEVVVNVAPSPVASPDVIVNVEKQEPPTVTIQADTQAVVEAIDRQTEALKPPAKLTVTDAEGNVTEVKPE